MKDEIFAKPIEKKFEFDEAVATVFDDMLGRSVPFYDEVQKLLISYILERQRDGLEILDLGSSTAKFLLDLNAKSSTKMKLRGLDNSLAMVEHAKAKCKAYGVSIDLEFGDMITHDLGISDIIVANYTLQFIRPLERPSLVQNIYNSLSTNGIFIFSEKVIFDDKLLDKQMIDIYYEFKKSNGYSAYEIAQKREALENVLIPFTIKENIQMCKDAGFNTINTIFQWGNFVSFVAFKK
jgi:tRNA (cmo5U34)-methyltransferase